MRPRRSDAKTHLLSGGAVDYGGACGPSATEKLRVGWLRTVSSGR